MKALFICDNKEEWTNLSQLFMGNFPKVELVCALNGHDAIAETGVAFLVIGIPKISHDTVILFSTGPKGR